MLSVATGGVAGGIGYTIDLARRRQPDGGSAPVMVHEDMVEDFAQPQDSTRGAAFAAVSIRLVLHRCIPDEALEWIDRFCARWTQVAFEPEPVKSPGQKAYEDMPFADNWDDVPPGQQEEWEAYAKRRGIE